MGGGRTYKSTNFRCTVLLPPHSGMADVLARSLRLPALPPLSLQCHFYLSERSPAQDPIVEAVFSEPRSAYRCVAQSAPSVTTPPSDDDARD